ncbi:phosphoglycerate kinase [Coxiella endosymbiont of Amblyomma americanum]|uniref:phosphoglycerate kinase n=1 Tax=Coxiella endosymbiont of Amblyomma americanum TaxID=325775 RepID=UPI00057D5C7F|nr:phosphoglycerate kinase [Coxiella endosymbiont of Amblyomma americanum]AJC50183.1 phosphoglycerate kinase [Coxiella endosymbiont of Amblyomma americanum]AUJ58544.1 phosphoglycerate kinase [Coxiella-like endosymbiont of Amblyomma americanum]
MLKLPCLSMFDINISNKRVLIREDFNTPVINGKIVNDEKVVRAIPTIEKALKENAQVIILSHFGRPKEGKFDITFSLAPIANILSKKLKRKIPLIVNWLQGIPLALGTVVLCENVRFNIGENSNDCNLAQNMAKLCDVFVMDAFATAHRVQASTVGIAKYAPIACAGPLLISEIETLSHVMHNLKKPLVAIVGGAKVSSKLHLLESLLYKVDQLIVGGGIANTLLKARGYCVGQSLCDNSWLDCAHQFLAKAKKKNVSILLPSDVVVARQLSKNTNTKAKIKKIDAIRGNESIFDVGPRTLVDYVHLIAKAGSIFWNGPIGVFEIRAFSRGTRVLAQAIADSSSFSIAGGGDTLAALHQLHLTHQISYISTGGGAFLKFLDGKVLPIIATLTQRAQIS